MKPIVLLDTDGVKADFLTPALEVAHRITGKRFTTEDITDWDMFSIIGKEHEKECFAEYGKPGFCANLKPYPESIEAVAELQEVADLYVVTSPMFSPTWMWERSQWLHEHYKIPFRRIMHASAKQLIFGDVFIDDKWSTVEDWKRRHPLGWGVLWEAPYNRSADIHKVGPRTMRVDNWEVVINLVKSL